MNDVWDGLLTLHGDPPVAASLPAGVVVRDGQISAPWLTDPVAVPVDASLFDEATAECYDLGAVFAELAVADGLVMLDPWRIEEGD